MRSAKTLLLLFALATGFFPSAQTALRFDVLITEIMADPTPVVGLPNAEFIELTNVSANAINLIGWRISDVTGTATINTSFVLQPDSMVILCSNANVAACSLFGRTIGVTSFPSLDNDGELLTLRSPQNSVIHAVEYSADWYRNSLKKEGGWTLEMIDLRNPCTGKENWKESTNNLGGTPGKLNAVNGTINDTSPPQIKNAYALDSLTVMLIFNEPLDSIRASVPGNYSLPGFIIISATPLSPLFHSVQLKLSGPMQRSFVYNLSIANLADCKGNVISSSANVKVGLPQVAGGADVIINEMLFNPRSGAYDYVEFYNRSKHVIDASTLSIANRNSSGATGSIRSLSAEPFYLFPGDYVVVTEDKASLQKEYLVKNEAAVLSLASLPSFPDDAGTVVLLNGTGDVVDEVNYDKAWHFALLDKAEGVALERLSPEAPSQSKNSWHSAATTAGYGTPGYVNSQFLQREAIDANIAVTPAIFSPDNDGRDDFATIQYGLAETGFVANISVFDAGGSLVRYLVKNELLSLKGSWKWDGLGANMNRLPIGTYIIYTEIFNTTGKKKTFRNTIVLARRLN